MKFKLILLFTLFLIFSCNSQEKEIKYPLIFKSPKGGVFDMIKYQGKYSLNEVLTLKPDSTYVYKMCAQLETGKWNIKNDTIYLFCESIKFHVDSLNKIDKYKKGTICSETPDTWVIKGNKIKNKYYKKVLLKN